MELKSIAFIPDGNRRYAMRSGLEIFNAHKLGTQKAWDVLDWLKSYPRITTGTFWGLSLENFLNRTALELKILFKIFDRELDKVDEDSVFNTEKIKLKFIGRTDLFPKSLREKLKQKEIFTADFKKKTMNIALAYGGKAEIVYAAKKLAEEYGAGKVDLSEVDEKEFSSYLYDDFKSPDLVIRTGGMRRLSGFMPFQSAYSELYFTEKLWPEFGEQDLADAINYYGSVQRNFGK